jgi:TRAP transporter TAXI family solute receptor
VKKTALVAITATLMMLCFVFAAAAGGTGEKATQGRTIAFYSGSPGGGWYPIAVAIADVWGKNIPGLTFTHADAGGAGNIIAISEGKAQAAITTGASLGDAAMGNPPFEKKITNVRGLAAFAPEYYAILVWADSGINTPADLKGKRLAPAPRGYTVEVITRSVLKAAGLSYDDMAKVDFMDLEESAGLMKDGHIDAMVASISTTGDPTITDLETNRPVKVLEIPNDMMAKLQAASPGITPAILPKGSYKGVTKDIQIPSYSLGVAIAADLPDDLVYNMTKFLAENWSSLQVVSADLAEVKPEQLARPVLGVPYHPGALKYYREKGWAK